MKKILIVDDNEITREGLIRIIGRIDTGKCEILEAEDGQSAEKLALETRPDIILTDIKMPNMTGLEMINRLKHRLSDTRYIIISGYDDFIYAREAIKLGVVDYLLKPLNSVDVENLIKRLLGSPDSEQAEVWNEEKTEQKAIISFAIDYINNNYAKDLNLSYVANLVSKSYNYFSTIFKNETGSTFCDYLRNVRIEKAKELLKDMNNSALDVSKAVGFRNYIHFSKIFTRVVGVNPAKYRSHS